MGPASTLFAKSCWYASPVGYCRGAINNFNDWLEKNLSRGSNDDHASVVMVIWQIWRNRNDVVWKGRRGSASHLVHAGLNFLQQWVMAQSLLRGTGMNAGVIGDMKWQKPPSGSIKCNVDAAIFQALSKVGYGCIIKDSKGGFIAWRSEVKVSSVFIP
ncbi:hypothetical protein PTKIN_Ptkin04bG0119700 [Pterospermum kingtungense]